MKYVSGSFEVKYDELLNEAIKMLDNLFGNKIESRRELLDKYYQTLE